MVLYLVLEKCRRGLSITREKIQMNVLEVTTSLKIPQQDFRNSNSLAVRFMRNEVLTGEFH
jgi:hypothetical protein